MLELYHHGSSVCAAKVRLILAEKNLDWTGHYLDILAGEQFNPDYLKLNPKAIFLSNGPGDPAATHNYSGPIIKTIISQKNLPVFGICLGHQLLGLALGAQTKKMHHGHHGANHPVKELKSNKVLVTSMNHGFAIDSKSLPKGTTETYKSLFDDSNCGIEVHGRPIFSVQFHPEASPGPMDADHLFQKFASSIE